MRASIDIEVTDTFGGEANYCWVIRKTIQVRKAVSRRTVVRKVKEVAGWTGWCRVRVSDFGDLLEIRPTIASGVNQVAFVTFRWNDTDSRA